MASTVLTVLLFLLFTLLSLHFTFSAGIIVPEEGYTVATILDGHKLGINPRSVLLQPGSPDLIVLDSASSVFYTVQFPITQGTSFYPLGVLKFSPFHGLSLLESVVQRFSGDGSAGYSDGDVGSAQFNKPRSFAVDLKGNVYVADKNNRVIRKISGAGVTTIAGGFSQSSGSKDGPALNVSFSNDFELAFIPSQCALLVSDHMYQLVRQINLKEEDCTLGSKSGIGAVMVWSLGLGLSCLLGLVIGIAVRPYIIPHEGPSPPHLIETWKHCLISLGKLVPIICFGIRSAVASSSSSSIFTILMRLWRLSLSHLLLMFRTNLVSPRPHHESVSLIDLDAYSSGEVRKSSKYFDQLKDLMSFDEDLMDSTNKIFNQGSSDVFPEYHGADVAIQGKIIQQGTSVCNLGLVKRR